MRFFLRVLALSVVLILFIPAASVSAGSVRPPEISAQAAVVFSQETEEFVYEKCPDERLPMASTTKIMTALLAYEYVDTCGDIIVTVDDETASTEGSSMGLETGDRICLSDLCAGMMLASGNDAANAVAGALGDDFPKLMNHRATELGMLNTNFVTPSGLDADAHYSSARDMAILSAEAMRNESFAAMASSQTMEIEYNNGEKKTVLTNHNKLLWQLPGCAGVKTGYTEKSGRCLVSAVKRDGVSLICVTLNAPDDWNDHKMLYEHAFGLVRDHTPENRDFILQTTGFPVICTVEKCRIYCFADSEIIERIYLPRFIYAGAYSDGDIIGRVDYISEGKRISTKNIVIN